MRDVKPNINSVASLVVLMIKMFLRNVHKQSHRGYSLCDDLLASLSARSVFRIRRFSHSPCSQKTVIDRFCTSNQKYGNQMARVAHTLYEGVVLVWIVSI